MFRCMPSSSLIQERVREGAKPHGIVHRQSTVAAHSPTRLVGLGGGPHRGRDVEDPGEQGSSGEVVIRVGEVTHMEDYLGGKGRDVE